MLLWGKRSVESNEQRGKALTFVNSCTISAKRPAVGPMAADYRKRRITADGWAVVRPDCV